MSESVPAKAGSAEWCPLLRTGDLRISLCADGTLEIRDGQTIYVQLPPPETADLLRWIDARDRPANPVEKPGSAGWWWHRWMSDKWTPRYVATGDGGRLYCLKNGMHDGCWDGDWCGPITLPND